MSQQSSLPIFFSPTLSQLKKTQSTKKTSQKHFIWSSSNQHMKCYILHIISGKPRRGRNARTWSNDDLKNALEAVKTSRLNTSQASKTYGIPYNSLLMYVRGRYGKTMNIPLTPSSSPTSLPATPQQLTYEQPEDLRVGNNQQTSTTNVAASYPAAHFLHYADPFPFHMTQSSQIPMMMNQYTSHGN